LRAFGIVEELTLSERTALAAASMAIYNLPGFMQQASNAADMQAMLVDPRACGRGGYIVAQAMSILNSFSGWNASVLDEIDDKSKIEACEKLIARAIEQGTVPFGGSEHFDSGKIIAS